MFVDDRNVVASKPETIVASKRGWFLWSSQTGLVENARKVVVALLQLRLRRLPFWLKPWLKGPYSLTTLFGAMFEHSELTPPARVGKRRTVSPLHEMDGAAEGSPCSTPELQSTDSRVSMEGLANVIRAEIQAGLAPIETKMNTLQSSIDNRLEQLDKMVCGQGVSNLIKWCVVRGYGLRS